VTAAAAAADRIVNTVTIIIRMRDALRCENMVLLFERLTSAGLRIEDWNGDMDETGADLLHWDKQESDRIRC
jgi:hypothetical protein